MIFHKGIKPFQCKICQKTFGTKFNYNFHMKKHKKTKFIIDKNNKEIINKEKENNFCNNKNDNLNNSKIDCLSNK